VLHEDEGLERPSHVCEAVVGERHVEVVLELEAVVMAPSVVAEERTVVHYEVIGDSGELRLKVLKVEILFRHCLLSYCITYIHVDIAVDYPQIGPLLREKGRDTYIEEASIKGRPFEG
jgi:hypothetical protein